MHLRLAAAEMMGEDTRSQWPELQSLAERVGDLGVLSDVLHWEGEHRLYYTCEFTTATTYLDRSREVAERWGAPDAVVWQLFSETYLHYIAGAWKLARAKAERAERISREIDPRNASLLSCLALVNLGLLDIAEGRGQEPAQNAERAVSLAYASDAVQALHWAAWSLAERDLMAGRVSDAYARLDSLLDRHGMQGETGQLWPLLAWAELELGQDEQAATTLATSLARRERLFHVDALRVRARVAIKHRRWQEAVADLEETLARCRAMSYPYAEAKAHYVFGQLHAARSEPTLAREHYKAALLTCGRLGERLYRPHIERALAELGAE
jgi:hypothetical protein